MIAGASARVPDPREAARAYADAGSRGDAEALYELHWLIKGLGQSICTDTAPSCGRCPLKQDCPRVDVGVGRKVVAFERPRSAPRQGSAAPSQGARLI